MDNLQHVARQRALTRRRFLRSAAVAGAGPRLLGFAPLRAAASPRKQKTVVVTFGGGARDEEAFAPEGQENIPHLLNELIPQSTFFTQVVNGGILGHYVATASLATASMRGFITSPMLPRRTPRSSNTSAKGWVGQRTIHGSSHPATASIASAKAAEDISQRALARRSFCQSICLRLR